MVISDYLSQAHQNNLSDDPFHLLVDGVKDYAIYMLDEGGHVATWNAGAERIKGYKSHEIIGRHYSAFFTPEDREAGAPEQLLTSAKDRGRTESVGTRVRKDGSHFTADVVITALYGPDGVLRGYGKVTRDITRRISHEQEVREASRRKDEFLAVLAHELRNPLAPIMSRLILLTEDRTVRTGAQEHVKAIQRQARHLIRLLDDLLDVARIERGKITIHEEKFALQDVLALAVEMTDPFITMHEQHLHVDIIPDEQIAIKGDFARLAQVISNLLNNAAKFNDTGGEIWLTARRAGAEAIVTVKDNGIGIPGEAIPHLFENFYRAEHPPHRTRDGMGVGLSLAYQLVRLHGGSMEVRSGGSGLGSELIVSLPACPDEENLTPVPAKSAPHGPKQRLLVVDDNTDAGDALAAVLQVSGHDVITVVSGKAALSALAGFHPDAIIIDIGMPDMNGFELAERVRRLPLFRSVRLIAVSGYGQEKDRERSKEAGFDAHLLKPVEMDDLLSALRPKKSGRSLQ